MNKQGLLDFAYSQLADILEKPGHILYSGHSSLKKGDIYVLGFNPGGDDKIPLKIRMANTLTSDFNEYLDESWNNTSSTYKEGEAPLQRRICWLLTELGANPRDVCASNLIFTRSRAAKDISYSIAKICWPVHEAIIEIVQPKLILTFGNSSISPYGYLKTLLGATREETMQAGHGNWSVCSFRSLHQGRPILVVGMPHLSRYNPIGKQGIIDWIKKQMSALQ